MSWQGANVSRRKRPTSYPQRRSAETVEAALNRLSKSYVAAMDCVGACHMASHEAQSQESVRSAVVKVARTARTTLEQSILIDPLVLSNAPGLVSIWDQWANDETDDARRSVYSWMPKTVSAQSAPVLTSTGHRSTVQKLSYLSLLNYADLLLSGCSDGGSKATILDRGAIKPLLEVTDGDTHSCWLRGAATEMDSVGTTEPHEDTVRLALASYIDAVYVDGSDPTTWFKLAACSRRLDNILEGYKTPRRLRRMERHALECAHVCWVSTHRPPVGIIANALLEWEKTHGPDCSIDSNCVEYRARSEQDVLQVSLPRYSWAVMGRHLARAFREGTNFHSYLPDTPSHHRGLLAIPSVKINVNPILTLHISPLLALPSLLLGKVVEYLDEASRVHIQCTCRALSVALAHRHMTRASTNASSFVGTKLVISNETQVEEHKNMNGSEDVGDKEDADIPCAPSDGKEDKSAQASRVSKRLKTRVETSGKKAERSARRSSVSFCLLGATLGPPLDEAVNSGVKPDGVSPQLKQDNSSASHRVTSHSGVDVSRTDTKEQGGSASLTAFICSLSESSPTPAVALFRFLSHVSMHVDDVYACESHGSLVLSSCVMDALELLTRRIGFNDAVPCWCAESSRNVGVSPLELFAVDLLHAEFRFKQCERDENLDTSFDGDINSILLAMPCLLAFVEEFESEHSTQGVWSCLKIRCYWLFSSCLLWYARVVQNATDVRDIENECLRYVEKILELMQECGIAELRTPHLEGVGRTGPYWKKLSKTTLAAYKNETQASSVVLVAQDQFVEAISKLDNTQQGDSVVGFREMFISIGATLRERYESTNESFVANHMELIEDFFLRHGQNISTFRVSSSTDEIVSWFESIVPVTPIAGEQLSSLVNPSILTILAVCLSHSPEGSTKFANLLIGLVSALKTLREEVLVSFPAYDPDANGQSAMSDDDSSLDSGIQYNGQSVEEKGSFPLKIYSRLVALAVISLSRLIGKHGAEIKETQCHALVEDAFSFVIEKREPDIQPFQEFDPTEDTLVLCATSILMEALEKREQGNSYLRKQLHVKHLAAAVVTHRKVLQTVSGKCEKSPNERRKLLVVGSAHFLSRCCVEIGHLLSQNTCVISERKISRSGVLGESTFFIGPLCRSLIWLWEISSQQVEGQSKTHPEFQLVRQNLKIPVATAIVSLCGSAVSTRLNQAISQESDVSKGLTDSDVPEFEFSLLDVVDPDTSVANALLDQDSVYEEFLRVVFLAVQCIRIVSDQIGDDELVHEVKEGSVPRTTMSSLPLVLQRVLNFYADALLSNPADPEKKESLWGDYSFGTRSIGSHIDKLLHRVFKAVYGFNLVHIEGRESVGAVPADEPRRITKPESTLATTQLYRCVMRTCSHGRKMPPKVALLTITSGLPIVNETKRSEALKNFLFTDLSSSLFTPSNIKALVNQSNSWEVPFFALQDLLDTTDHPQAVFEENECDVVRRGLADLFSQGTMPSLENVADKDTRLQTMQLESELSNRFEAILYKLTHSHGTDCESWYRFSQLCLFKADIIAGTTLNPCCCHIFSETLTLFFTERPSGNEHGVLPV